MKTCASIRDLMRSGGFAAAEDALRARLAADAHDVEAKALYGICRRLQGDEAAFLRVDDELAADPAAAASPAWTRYHALRVAACGTLLVLAAGCSAGQQPPGHVYAGPPAVPVRKMPEGDVYAGPPMVDREKAPPPRPVPPRVRPPDNGSRQPPAPVYAGPPVMRRRPVPPQPPMAIYAGPEYFNRTRKVPAASPVALGPSAAPAPAGK